MATTKDFNEYFLDGLERFNVATRPMMGEYVVYCNGKVVGGIYDNRVLVKNTQSARRLMPEAELAIPYEGAKQMLILDNLDDKEFAGYLLTEISKELPLPKKKKK